MQNVTNKRNNYQISEHAHVARRPYLHTNDIDLPKTETYFCTVAFPDCYIALLFECYVTFVTDNVV